MSMESQPSDNVLIIAPNEMEPGQSDLILNDLFQARIKKKKDQEDQLEGAPPSSTENIAPQNLFAFLDDITLKHSSTDPQGDREKKKAFRNLSLLKQLNEGAALTSPASLSLSSTPLPCPPLPPRMAQASSLSSSQNHHLLFPPVKRASKTLSSSQTLIALSSPSRENPSPRKREEQLRPDFIRRKLPPSGLPHSSLPVNPSRLQQGMDKRVGPHIMEQFMVENRLPIGRLSLEKRVEQRRKEEEKLQELKKTEIKREKAAPRRDVHNADKNVPPPPLPNYKNVKSKISIKQQPFVNRRTNFDVLKDKIFEDALNKVVSDEAMNALEKTVARLTVHGDEVNTVPRNKTIRSFNSESFEVLYLEEDTRFAFEFPTEEQKDVEEKPAMVEKKESYREIEDGEEREEGQRDNESRAEEKEENEMRVESHDVETSIFSEEAETTQRELAEETGSEQQKYTERSEANDKREHVVEKSSESGIGKRDEGSLENSIFPANPAPTSESPSSKYSQITPVALSPSRPPICPSHLSSQRALQTSVEKPHSLLSDLENKRSSPLLERRKVSADDVDKPKELRLGFDNEKRTPIEAMHPSLTSTQVTPPVEEALNCSDDSFVRQLKKDDENSDYEDYLEEKNLEDQIRVLFHRLKQIRLKRQKKKDIELFLCEKNSVLADLKQYI